MSKKKIVLIIISIILAVLITVSGSLLYFIFSVRDKVDYDISEWSNLEKTYTYLPSVEEMGGYSDLKSKYQHRDCFIFQSDTYILRATYSEEAFDIQKDAILNNYSFQENVVDYGEEVVEKKATFNYDDFHFQMLSLNKYNLYYPKEMVFVGISEKKNEIAFIYFYDIDLDYIGSSFEDFIVNECGWE